MTIADYHRKRREDERTKVKRLFSLILDAPRPRLRIEDFERDWLNVFFGEPIAGETIPILKWVIEVSGSPYVYVDIVKGGRAVRSGQLLQAQGGEVVFSVPPILYSDGVLLPEKHTSFFELVMELKDRIKRHPAEGERYMEANIAPLFLKNEDTPTFVDEMNEIARYYGYPTIGGAKDASSSGTDSAGGEVVESVPDF